ncbi:hypothetical protein [Streptomyces sp. NPDC001889]
MVWPPRSSDPQALLNAYTEVLGWPLSADGAPVTGQDVGRVWQRSPLAKWTTLCVSRFDAVVVAGDVGAQLALLVERDHRLEAEGVVLPCLIAGAERVFFVSAGSGRLAKGEGIRVLSGDQRVTLPPSDDLRWETPPWSRGAPEPIALPDARVLTRGLGVCAAGR